jgi:drug/metabolite transporter (DMT)-like permease
MSESRSKITSAVILLNIGLIFFVVHDALSKALTARYPLFEIIFLRSVFALPLVLILLRWEQGSFRLRTGRFWALVGRGVLSVMAFSCFLYGLTLMPLADTFALFMSAPLLIAALTGPLLGEPASRQQWIAVSVGFAAVLFMIRPGGSIPLLGALVMFAAVTAFSCSIILTRALGRSESASIMTVFVMIVFVIASGAAIPFAWRTPSATDLLLMMALGALAAGAMYCTISAYKSGPPALLAPFQYVSLIWAGVIGYAVWGDVPESSVVLAGVVVVGSGLFVLHSGTKR